MGTFTSIKKKKKMRKLHKICEKMWVFTIGVLFLSMFIHCQANSASSFYWNGGSSSVDQDNSPGWPGGRGGAAIFRKLDGSGLFAFGGNSSRGLLSDLWELSDGRWTLVHAGDPLASYGTLNVESAYNRPGPRHGSACWIDPSGVGAFLFGGYGKANGTTELGCLNDVWYFSFATRQWTWIGGTPWLRASGNYPPIGSNDPGTLPRARRDANVAQRGSKVYLFGGAYESSTSSSPPGVNWIYLNDFFVFDTSTREFTYLRGSNVGSVAGDYSSDNPYPGGREGTTIWWRNTIFYMALGFGHTTSTLGFGQGTEYSSTGFLHEVWSCNTADPSFPWTLRSGTTQLNRIASYGNAPLRQNTTVSIGSRKDAIGFALSDGVLIVGGTGYSTSQLSSGWLADAFLFDESNNQWVWYGGPQGINQLGSYTQPGWPGGFSSASTFISTNGTAFTIFGRSYTGYLNGAWTILLPASVRDVVIVEQPSAMSNEAIFLVVFFAVMFVAFATTITIVLFRRHAKATKEESIKDRAA